MQILHEAFKVLVENGCVLSRESLSFDPSTIKLPEEIKLLTIHTTPTEKFILLTERKINGLFKVIDITGDCSDFGWLPYLREAISSDSGEILVLAQNDPTSGILGLVNCMRREPGGERIRCVYLQNEAPAFNADSGFYKNQLNKGFVMNVYKNGQWGTYRHLLLDDVMVINEHCFAEATVQGDLSSIRWLEGELVNPPTKSLEPDKELIYVNLLQLEVMICLYQIYNFRITIQHSTLKT